MAIKAIIFDCYGVLVTSPKDALINNYPHLKTQIDDLGHQSDYGLISRQQFDESIADLIGISSDQVESQYLRGSIKDENAISWVRTLKQSGIYKIGVLSNVGRGFFNDYLSLSEQKELFDEVVLSSDVGLAKPEIAIFELIAKKLGVKPSECVLIDDGALNIETAKNAGMQGVWFISTQQAIDDLNTILEAENA